MIVARSFKGPLPPALILGKRYVVPTIGTPNTDAEGDTLMGNQGNRDTDTLAPVTLPVGAPVLRAANAPTFGNITSSTDYSVAPSSAFEIATPPPPPTQEREKGKGKDKPAVNTPPPDLANATSLADATGVETYILGNAGTPTKIGATPAEASTKENAQRNEETAPANPDWSAADHL